MIKQFILKTLFRSRFHVGYLKGNHWLRKYFWRIESARKFADSLAGRSIVWSSNYEKIYQANNVVNFSTHEDAKNFNTNI